MPGIKGGYLGVVQHFPQRNGAEFLAGQFAFTVCFMLTLVISLATRRTKTDEELKGLVYSLTPRLTDHDQPFLLRPAVLGTHSDRRLRHS